jgi:Protein of unknown function (DUF3052)
MKETHGYSRTPLPKKLGISPGLRVVTINAPAHYRRLLGELPEDVSFITQIHPDARFIHLFGTKRGILVRELKRCRSKIADDGTIWVSWPKKSSGVETDITEDTIRDVALPLGLVDTKVCAVDEIWSGLKLMVRRENRSKRPEK